MSKGERVLILSLLALASVLFLFLNRSREPSYHGLALSEYLAMASQEHPPILNGVPLELEGTHAVRKIGTNALPFLLKWIRYERPMWRKMLSQRLTPQWLAAHPGIAARVQGEGAGHQGYAITGFGILGTNAAAAIPELDALGKDRTHPYTSIAALYALTFIGEPSIPVLRSALADTNQPNRPFILFALPEAMAKNGIRTYEPLLREALSNDDIGLREAATNILQNLPASTPN